MTPLFLAMLACKPDVIKLLIEQFGADLELEVDNGATVLFQALGIDDLPVLKQLLECGARVDHRDGYGRTPLHCAVAMRRPVLVDLLISYGADVNIRHYGDSREDRSDHICSGATPLEIALALYNRRYKELQNDNAPAAVRDARLNEHLDVIKHLVPHTNSFDVTVNSDGSMEEDSNRCLPCVQLCFTIECEKCDLRLTKYLLRNGRIADFHVFYITVKHYDACNADLVTASFVKLCLLSGCTFSDYLVTMKQEKEEGQAGQDHRSKHVHALVKDVFSQPLSLQELSIMAIRKSIGSRQLWAKIDALQEGIPRHVKDMIQLKTYMY